MRNKKNVPDIRFKGFAEEWRNELLGELATFSKGRGYSKGDLVEIGSPVILYGRLYTKYQTVISDVDTFAIQKQDSILSKGVEVVVPASGETAEDISRASAIIKPNIIIAGDLNIIYPNNEMDSVFLALSISNGDAQKNLSKKAQGKSVVHLHNSDLYGIDLKYPAVDEQKVIGNYFQNIDRLIVVSQEKLDKLKTIKKACLEKMFPRNDSNIPEVRFNEFSEIWNTKHLSDDEFDVIAGGDVDKEKLIPKGRYPVFANALVNEGIVGYYDKEYRITAPAVTVTGRGDVGYAKARKINFTPVVRLLAIKSSHDVDYLENAINKHKVLVESTGVPQLTVPQIKKYEIWFPNNRSEEEKIGLFLLRLDSLMNLYNQKIEKLKNIKKACLDKMFVNTED